MVDLKKVIYLIPFRDNGDPLRLENLRALQAVLKTHLPELTTKIVEQDVVQKTDSLFFYNPGKFNKGWALNAAAKTKDVEPYEYLFFGDADFILQPAELLASIQEFLTVDAVSPYGDEVTYMTKEESEEFRSTLSLPYLTTLPPRRERRAMMKNLPFAAGIFGIKKSAFFQIGGYPEEFEGWGGEDCSLSHKIKKAITHKQLTSNKAYHLFHKEPFALTTSERMRQIYGYAAQTKKQILEAGEASWPAYGNPDKYKKT